MCGGKLAPWLAAHVSQGVGGWVRVTKAIPRIEYLLKRGVVLVEIFCKSSLTTRYPETSRRARVVISYFCKRYTPYSALRTSRRDECRDLLLLESSDPVKKEEGRKAWREFNQPPSPPLVENAAARRAFNKAGYAAQMRNC